MIYKIWWYDDINIRLQNQFKKSILKILSIFATICCLIPVLSHLRSVFLFLADATVVKHHSGHFRHESAEIWDPHPKYQIKAFGKKLLLELEQDDRFVAPGLHVSSFTQCVSNIQIWSTKETTWTKILFALLADCNTWKGHCP